MNKPGFIYVTYIDTTLEQLWEALTTARFTRQYWGGREIDSDWVVGSAVRHVRPDGELDWQGTVLEADPPRLLSYTFEIPEHEHQGDEPESRVTFELQPFGSVIRLTVTHHGYDPESKAYRQTSEGWSAILSSLKSLLETGSALEYPWKG